MLKSNFQKKQEVEKVVHEYELRMRELKQRRDKLVSDFSEVLKEKRLEELRKSIKRL